MKYNSDVFDAELSSDEEGAQSLGNPRTSAPPSQNSDDELIIKPSKDNKKVTHSIVYSIFYFIVDSDINMIYTVQYIVQTGTDC